MAPTRVKLTEKERSLPYAKYYDLPMTEIPEDKVKILQSGPMKPENAMPISRRWDLFKQDDPSLETGFCVMEDGTGYVANLTPMPGVTPDMIEWWFAWHGLEDLRYRIWDPEDHFYARQQTPEKVLDPNVPMREKTWGTTHLVLEDVGMGPGSLILNFLYPDRLGFDIAQIGTKACATMMCASGLCPVPAPGINILMVHFVRKTTDGIELRSRFWIGYDVVDGQVVKAIPDGIEVPLMVPQCLFTHCIKEFTHLATILPQIYAENKDSW